MSEPYTAKILWKSERDGNGIIRTVCGYDFYFDTSVTTDFDTLKRGDYVDFEINSSIRECNCAKNVRKAS
jgi:cold shock CspA family protein